MIRLYFLKAAAHPFNPGLDPDQDDYYEVQAIPRRELTSRRLVDGLEYMLEQTNKPSWRGRMRRPATLGDIVTIDRSRYVIIEDEYRQSYAGRGSIIDLPLWRQFCVVHLVNPGESNGWFKARL